MSLQGMQGRRYKARASNRHMNIRTATPPASMRPHTCIAASSLPPVASNWHLFMFNQKMLQNGQQVTLLHTRQPASPPWSTSVITTISPCGRIKRKSVLHVLHDTSHCCVGRFNLQERGCCACRAPGHRTTALGGTRGEPGPHYPGVSAPARNIMPYAKHAPGRHPLQGWGGATSGTPYSSIHPFAGQRVHTNREAHTHTGHS